MSPIPLGILSAQIAGSPFFVAGLKYTSTSAAYDISATSTGDFYVSGVAGGAPFAVKLDVEGNLIWEVTQDVSGSYQAAAINSSGDLQFAGGANPGNQRNCLTKMTPSGTITYSKQIGFTNSSNANGVGVDSSDNVFIHLLNSNGINSGVHKYDSSGTLVWAKGFFSNSSNLRNRPVGMSVKSDGEVFVTYRDDESNFAKLFAKLTTSGGLAGTRTIDDGYPTYDVDHDSTGKAYWAFGYGHIAQLDTSLNSLTQRRVGTSAGTSIKKLFVDSSDNVYGYGAVSGGTIIVKFDSSMNLQWQRKLVGVTSSGRMTETIDGGILISGQVGLDGIASPFFAYLPADGSITGSGVIGGTTVSVEISTESISTTNITLTSEGYPQWNTSTAETGITTTVSDPNFALSLENI